MSNIEFDKGIEVNEVKENSTTFEVVCLRPGGNDTALCIKSVDSLDERKRINDFLMNSYSNIEQVGFINLDVDNPELMMAGGEFCGNATRSSAWRILEGKPGLINIKVSGVDRKLKAGVSQDLEAFAQMPIYPDISNISFEDQNKKNCTVKMEGITHYIDFDRSKIDGLSNDEIKVMAMDTIKSKGLDKFPAAGVIFVSEKENGLDIFPVVYVRDINTVFCETACGSGTTAVGMCLALSKRENIKDVPIIQPTGLPIKVSVDFDGSKFGEAFISGPVEELNTLALEIDNSGNFLVEQVKKKDDLEKALSGGLTDLYKDIFGRAPYYEKFEDEEIKSIFSEYFEDGMLFVTRENDKVIGFVAALPISSVPDIGQIMTNSGYDMGNCWYMADLGVSLEHRRKGLGRKLTKIQVENLPGKDILLRTSINNLIAQRLYHSLSFAHLSNVYQDVMQARVDDSVVTDQRLFMLRTGDKNSERKDNY